MPSVLSYVVVAVLYLAGSVAASEAGWVATVKILSLKPGLGRAVLVALAEAFVGLGTGLLGLMIAGWTEPDRAFTFVLAATVGVAVGVYRQLKSFRNRADFHRTVHDDLETPASARSAVISQALLREVTFGGASRIVGVAAVLVGLLVAYAA